jgi:hypothetical protein
MEGIKMIAVGMMLVLMCVAMVVFAPGEMVAGPSLAMGVLGILFVIAGAIETTF